MRKQIIEDEEKNITENIDEKSIESIGIQDNEKTTSMSYTEIESELVKTQVELQQTREELNRLNQVISEKDQIITGQSAQIQLYITKYNKDEITIDALQTKILDMIQNQNR